MFETGRRSATSTSELGLYSDRSDHYHRNRYGIGVRKYVIGVMVVLAIILVSVLLYDFTSGATVINNGAKETKHIYILQNALKRPINSIRKTTTTASPFNHDGNSTELLKMEDRSDGNYNEEKDTGNSEDLEDQITSETRSITIAKPDPEFRSQNLNNFNLRKRLLSMDEDESEEKVRAKESFDNNAMVYRLRQRYKYPASEEDTSLEESRPIPFHFEYKTPIPTSFKRSKYPQLAQYRYPQNSNNIQDIIKYLTKEKEKSNRGIKFSGVYVNPKKFDFHPETGEMMSNSDRSEEENPSPISYSFNSDPFYQYKPKNPSDVNLLATPNVRFSPPGIHRYNPSFYDTYFPRPPMNFNTQLSSSSESQYDNYGSHTTATFGKKRKPKPFSVMLDIYPIPDSADPNRKSSRPRSGLSGQQNQNQASPEEYDVRRPISHNKGSKYSHSLPSSQPISLVAVPSSQSTLDDEERQQMIFHLNLYPKRRNKLNRNDIIPRSHRIEEEMDEKVPTPFDTVTKHLTDHSAIQVSKFEDTQLSDEAKDSHIPKNPRLNRYEESELDEKSHSERLPHDDDRDNNRREKNDKSEDNRSIPENHRPDFTVANITRKYFESSDEKFDTISESACNNCKNLTYVDEDAKLEDTEKTIEAKLDIDTVEGFEDFADGLLATD